MSALLGLIAQGGFGDGHMGGRLGLAGGCGHGRDDRRHGLDDDAGERGGNGRGLSEDPVEVLKARYARSELTTEEFQQRLRTIQDARR